MIRAILSKLRRPSVDNRQQLAIERLEQITAERRNSPEVREYEKRRKAALKHTPKVWAQ